MQSPCDGVAAVLAGEARSCCAASLARADARQGSLGTGSGVQVLPWLGQGPVRVFQTFGEFATAEEAAWEQDLKRLELGYEAEGFYNYKLQLGQTDMACV